MRYYIRCQLVDGSLPDNAVHEPNWIRRVLPVHDRGYIADASWQTFQYEAVDRSFIESNWKKPYYFDRDHFLFIGGHVLNRIEKADKRGKYVPTPQEVLQLLLIHGDGVFNLLKGNFHILLFERTKKSVQIYSSPFSLYPAWYFVQNGVLHVSNVMESLLREKDGLTVNKSGLVEFSLFDHCLGDATIYRDIFLLTGGQCLDISKKIKKERLVYDIAKWITKEPIKRKDSLQQINDILKRHISEFIGSIKRFNIALTGGFDGRLNFSFIKKEDYARLQSFSYGMKGSLQLTIPKMISNRLHFNHKEILLDDEFEHDYAGLGMDSIIFTGGLTPFIRANYPFGYGKIKDFSRNCLIGQCDMIRPLYTNPAGAIFNNFSRELFYEQDLSIFVSSCQRLAKDGFLANEIFSNEIIEEIIDFVQRKYIMPYQGLSQNERYFLFLMKESMLKFWHTECHLVDLFVNDFISFSDLDYIETLSNSEYFGLYKGIFAKNQFQRRMAHDLYADLMHINNDELNNIIVDRLFKPKWLRKMPLGYLMIAKGKINANQRARRIGNDTFAEDKWSSIFYEEYRGEIEKNNQFFDLINMKENMPYQDENRFRYERHVSLKLWLHYIGIE